MKEEKNMWIYKLIREKYLIHVLKLNIVDFIIY